MQVPNTRQFNFDTHNSTAKYLLNTRHENYNRQFKVCSRLIMLHIISQRCMQLRVRHYRHISDGLETERKRFKQMTKMVTSADYFLSVHHGASFACNIANICLMLYMLAFYPSSGIAQTVALIFWLFACAADIAVVCGVSIVVNTDVRFSYSYYNSPLLTRYQHNVR